MKKLIRLFQNFYSDPPIQQAIGTGIILFFTICYSILLLNKYWQFEFFGWDNVYFDTALWKLAHLQAPIVYHPILGYMNIFGDHFHPTIFFFSMLYWLTSRQEIILIGMSVVYGMSAFLSMQIGFKLLKSRFLTFSLLAAYFLYEGTQHAMIYGFHEINLVPLFFMLTAYLIVFNHWRWYWVSLFLLLLTKESLAVVAVCLGIFIFFCIPKKRLVGLITLVLSVGYYFLAVKIIIPHIGGGFFYGSDIDYPNSVGHFIHLMTSPPEKIETFVVSMATFGFLPLLNVFTWPLLVQDFITRYIIAVPGNVQYTLFYHYNIGLAPLLLFSSIWSLKTIQENKLTKRFITFLPILGLIVLIFSLYFHRLYKTRGPLLEVFNKAFYQTTKDNAFEWELIRHVPNDGPVMTQNQLAYMFTHQGSYLFPSPKDLNKISQINPKYIVIDFRDGQNPNDYFPLDKDLLKRMTDDYVSNKLFEVYYHKGAQFIFKRIVPTLPVDFEKMKVKVALINTEGHGTVGCGDSIQYSEQVTPYTPDVLKSSLEKLLSINVQRDPQSDLYDALFQSNLHIEKLFNDNNTASIYLEGTLQLGGVCDNPRVKAQIEQTALQFPDIKKVEIFLNGKPIDEALSLKG